MFKTIGIIMVYGVIFVVGAVGIAGMSLREDYAANVLLWMIVLLLCACLMTLRRIDAVLTRQGRAQTTRQKASRRPAPHVVGKKIAQTERKERAV